jgi:hypothetical protein
MFQNRGSLSFRVSVEEKLYQPLIVYGQIVLKKNLDLEIEEWKIPQKKIMLLHFIQRREENSKEISGKHLKVKSLHQTQAIKEEMLQKFNALDVTIMDTLQETAQPGRKEDNMLPPLTLIQTHLKRMKRRERRSTSSKIKA